MRYWKTHQNAIDPLVYPGKDRKKHWDCYYYLRRKQNHGLLAVESNCDCDRQTDPSLLQTVFMQNDQQVFKILDGKTGWINQLSEQYYPNSKTSRQKYWPDNYEKVLKYHRDTIEKAKKSGNKKKVASLQRNFAKLFVRQLELQSPVAKLTKPTNLTPA